MWAPVNDFLAQLEYSIDGSHHTVLYEGSWTTEDGMTRLRLDCQEFPAFWVSGKLAGGVLAIDGGRFDDTWTSRPVSHTEFV